MRADSERELAAASQRRDSINAQLANVRQMLTTLTGAAPVALTDETPQDPAPADESESVDEVTTADDEVTEPDVSDESAEPPR